jgi:phosphoserine phosphatase
VASGVERAAPTDRLPLVVDLDGTLIDGDLLHLSIMRLLLRRPHKLWALPLWLRLGKAGFKQRLGEAVDWSLDVRELKYRPEVLTWIRAQRAAGRHVVLATASPEIYAQRIAQHLAAFDAVFASSATVNLGGAAKAERLVAAFGDAGFVYAGDSKKDVPVWRVAAAAVPVYPSRALRQYVARNFVVETSFG